MAESVKVLPDNIQNIIEVQEWDMRTREGVERFRNLKAKSLPSVALDGELVYESIIPMQEELIAEIEKRYKEKNQDDCTFVAPILHDNCNQPATILGPWQDNCTIMAQTCQKMYHTQQAGLSRIVAQ